MTDFGFQGPHISEMISGITGDDAWCACLEIVSIKHTLLVCQRTLRSSSRFSVSWNVTTQRAMGQQVKCEGRDLKSIISRMSP